MAAIAAKIEYRARRRRKWRKKRSAKAAGERGGGWRRLHRRRKLSANLASKTHLAAKRRLGYSLKTMASFASLRKA
jgi:hypothetical protein